MNRTSLAVVTVAAFLILLLATGQAFSKTLILEGKLDGAVAMRQSMEFSVNKGTVSTFSFRFALPANFNYRTVTQSIEGFNADISPRPATSTVETDRFGNRFQKVTWENVSQDIRVSLNYTANVRSELSSMESKAPFPLGNRANQESQYLKATDMVQSGSGEMASMARQLTVGARNEYEAVMSISNWVADNIKYTFNPPQYDALYTLHTKSGNCQNFAHLSIALLRSLGIPARIVGGITLKDSWKVPIDARNSIVQSMGQGGHAWFEVWFPDLGWLPYDPQQSKQFTSSRHIKQSHGLDSKDINDTWRGGPYLPAYNELIEGRFVSDVVNLKMKRFDTAPRPYLLSNTFLASGVPSGDAGNGEQGEPVAPSKPKTPVSPKTEKPSGKSTPQPTQSQQAPTTPQGSGAGPAETRIEMAGDPPADDDDPLRGIKSKPKPKPPYKPGKPVKPVTVVAEPPHKKLKPGSIVLFGNMDFPALVSLYNVKGDTGTRIFERETSEYVTSKYIYAQAIKIKDRMSLDRISLAMRKFGGDGSVYIDLVRDNGGKPDIMHGTRSSLVDLEKITRKPGYYWVDFTFPPEGNKPQQLAPGKYWIVLRASGEAIMNWFFTPGKPYSEGDDTRSTAKGFQWEDILNYDFVFKVTGKAI